MPQLSVTVTLCGTGYLIMFLMWPRNEEGSLHCGKDVAVTYVIVFSGCFVFGGSLE